jgi:hypothetical protein
VARWLFDAVEFSLYSLAFADAVRPLAPWFERITDLGIAARCGVIAVVAHSVNDPYHSLVEHSSVDARPRHLGAPSGALADKRGYPLTRYPTLSDVLFEDGCEGVLPKVAGTWGRRARSVAELG